MKFSHVYVLISLIIMFVSNIQDEKSYANVYSTYAIKSTLVLLKISVYAFSNNGMVNNIILHAIMGNNNLLMVISNIERVIVKINIL